MHVDDHKTGDFLSALPLPQTTAHHHLPLSDVKTKHYPFSYSKRVTTILISKPQTAPDPQPSSSIASGPYSTFLNKGVLVLLIKQTQEPVEM